MMLANIKSEHGGVITFQYLIPVVYTPHGVPVSQGCRSGSGGTESRDSCQLHLVSVFKLKKVMGRTDIRILSRYLSLVATDMEQAHMQNSSVNLLEYIPPMIHGKWHDS